MSPRPRPLPASRKPLLILLTCAANGVVLCLTPHLWLVSVGYTLVAGGLFWIGRRPSEPAPAVTAPAPRDQRTGLRPADPRNEALLGTCPICGMDDAGRFGLDAGVTTWNGWPAHSSCVDWLRIGRDKPTAIDGGIRGPESGQYPQSSPPPAIWPVSAWPAGGMLVGVTDERGGHSLFRLDPADPARPRIDAICRYGPTLAPTLLVTGTGASSPVGPVLPAGAQLVALVYVPACCTQIGLGLITQATSAGVAPPGGQPGPSAGELAILRRQALLGERL